MPNIAASDVVVNLLSRPGRRLVEGVKQVYADIVFGDASLDYPAGGFPMPDLSVFGLLKDCFFIDIEQPGNGFLYQYVRATHKMKIVQSLGGIPAGTVTVVDHTHDLRLIGGITAAEAVACDGAALNFGKNAATNRVIAGANEATKGGVVPKTGLTGSYNGTAGSPGPFSEYSGKPAVTTIRLRLEGN